VIWRNFLCTHFAPLCPQNDERTQTVSYFKPWYPQASLRGQRCKQVVEALVRHAPPPTHTHTHTPTSTCKRERCSWESAKRIYQVSGNIKAKRTRRGGEGEREGFWIPGKPRCYLQMFLCIVWLFNSGCRRVLLKNPPGGIPVAVDVRRFWPSLRITMKSCRCVCVCVRLFL